MEWGSDSERSNLSDLVDAALRSQEEPEDGVGCSMQWAAPAAPRELSQDLLPIRDPDAVNEAPSELSECTPAALLPSVLRKDRPELNFTATPKRRCLSKKGLPKVTRGACSVSGPPRGLFDLLA